MDDPFGEGEDAFDGAFAVFDGSTTAAVTGQKRPREESDEKTGITDNLLTFGGGASKNAEVPKTREGEELEQIALREKMARRR
jgi:hypothetical protein